MEEILEKLLNQEKILEKILLNQQQIFNLLQNKKNLSLTDTGILTVNDLVKLLAYKKSYIHKLVYLKKIPYFKKANRLYFYHTEIIKWLQSNNNQNILQKIKQKHPWL